MEAVRIMCQLSESQIYKLADYVSACLPQNLDDLNDIDQVMMMSNIRLCVDFDVDALGNLKVLSAEILNRDWDVMDTDSFALKQYLCPIVDDYNARYREAKRQHRQILNDRMAIVNE